MTRTLTLLISVIVLAGGALPARSDSYPVSGRWTYRNVADKGPAETCDSPTMEFRGDRRFDTSGGVPDFRNVTVDQIDASLFAVNDLFLTWPNVRGNVYYSLRQIDDDHIEINIPRAGKTFVLRRCA